jgi:hypothetical protein
MKMLNREMLVVLVGNLKENEHSNESLGWTKGLTFLEWLSHLNN